MSRFFAKYYPIIYRPVSRGLNYMADFQVERMSPNLYQQSYVDLERFARSSGVFVKFPKQKADDLQPLSLIHI